MRIVSSAPAKVSKRSDLTHSPARGKSLFLFGALPSLRQPEVIALFIKPQIYAGFKEAVRATGRNVGHGE
jgi:hypothetical protein